MSTHGETRRRAYAAACDLAGEGKRPTLRSIRERLGGLGGQQAIQAGLQDWTDEAARRFALPGIPDALGEQMTALWEAACAAAEARWSGERETLVGRIDELAAALAERTGELEASRADLAESNERCDRLSANLDDARDAQADLTTEHEVLLQEHAKADAELRGLREAVKAQAEDLGHQRRLVEQAREAQGRAESDSARLGEKREALEQQLQEVQAALADARAWMEQRGQEDARTAETLAARDAQIERLTKALEQEQAGRAGDQNFWMARLNESKAALDDAKARELRALQERQMMMTELSVARSELDRLRLERLAELDVKPAEGSV